jgi:CelD/BcsL family acetyltransferase involved in cellulose biosynthesis
MGAATAALARKVTDHEARATVKIYTAEQVKDHFDEVQALFRCAPEANVFFEPWVLAAAIEAFGSDYELLFALIYAQDDAGGDPILCGFLPLERHDRYSRVPATAIGLWQYRECPLCTPPLRPGYEEICINAFLDWARSDAGAQLLDMRFLDLDSAAYKSMTDVLRLRSWKYIESVVERPALVRNGDYESFTRESLSSDHRRRLRKQVRQLSELGRIEYVEVGSDINAWIESFLKLEASGWKKAAGGATICHSRPLKFIPRVIAEAHRRGQLLSLGLLLDGELIAINVVLKSGTVGFGYKTAYDAQYAKYSPGIMLQHELIRRVFASSDFTYVDSCVIPAFAHSVDWLGRRKLADMLISTGTIRGDVTLAVAPAIHRAKQKFRLWQKTRVKRAATAAQKAQVCAQRDERDTEVTR